MPRLAARPIPGERERRAWCGAGEEREPVGGSPPHASINFGSRLDEPATRRVLDQAIDLGITFIDTADVYGRGASEAVIGDVIRATGERGSDLRIGGHADASSESGPIVHAGPVVAPVPSGGPLGTEEPAR